MISLIFDLISCKFFCDFLVKKSVIVLVINMKEATYEKIKEMVLDIELDLTDDPDHSMKLVTAARIMKRKIQESFDESKTINKRPNNFILFIPSRQTED